MGTTSPSLPLTGAAPRAETARSDWGVLYSVGGVAALVMVLITLIQFVVFAVAPPPLEGNAGDWFALFQKSPVLGLLGFDLALVVYALLSVVVALALFAALRPASPSLTALFLVLSVIGGIAFVVARPGLEMLSLSNQFAAATTEAHRAALLAAGEAMVAIFHGTAFQVSYFLGSLSGLVIAAAMLRSSLFSRGTAYLRIASSVFDLGLFIPGIGLLISLLSVVCLLVFNLLIARRLLQLGRLERPASRTGFTRA
jgi:hypothetical protein